MSETHLRIDEKLSKSSEPKRSHQKQMQSHPKKHPTARYRQTIPNLSNVANHKKKQAKCGGGGEDKWEISFLKNYSQENNSKETDVTIF